MSHSIPIETLVVNTDTAHTYRTFGDEYLAFLRDFIPRLYPGVEISYDVSEDGESLKNMPIHRCELYSLYQFQVPYAPLFQEPYVIIHTRGRFDGLAPNFWTVTLPEYEARLRSLVSSYPIVLFGEREVEETPETMSGNIRSLYPALSSLPGVIDMTRDTSASRNTIEEFERDVHAIHGAKFNVVFGYGGPLSLSMAFGRQTLAYVGGIQHRAVDDYFRHGFLHRDMDVFLEILQAKLM